MNEYQKLYRYAIPHIGTVDVPAESHRNIQEGKLVTVVVKDYTFFINRHDFIEDRLKKVKAND